MIECLVEVLQDTVDLGWKAAKGAHFALINRILDGHVSWKTLMQSIKSENVLRNIFTLSVLNKEWGEIKLSGLSHISNITRSQVVVSKMITSTGTCYLNMLASYITS